MLQILKIYSIIKDSKRFLRGTQRKILLDKYKAAFAYATEHVSKRIEQEREALAKSIEKPVGRYEITVKSKPVTIEQVQEIFPDVQSNACDLQKLLDSLDITVNFLPEEGEMAEEAASQEDRKEEQDRERPKEKEQGAEKEKVKEREGKGAKQAKSYSIKVDDRELNPDNYVLNNPHMAENITKLYRALVEKLGHSNFQFQVSGGDRYIGKDGKVYSSTNHQVIPNAKAKGAHLKDEAVDLRIKLADGSDIIPLEIVRKLVDKHTKFIFDPKGMPSDYPDKHYHLQLSNPKKTDTK